MRFGRRPSPERGTGRGLALRLLILHVGIMLFGLALALGYRASLGLDAWNVFQIALTKYIPTTPGRMSIAVGAAMLLVAWRAGVPPALGTVCNIVFTGLWFDVFAAAVPRAGRLVVALPMLLGGVALLGWSSALYLKAGFGAGPRDSFMLAVVRKTGWPIGVARAVIEGTVFACGVAMDRSQVGIGTLAFTFGIGPMLQWSFRVLRVPADGGRALPPSSEGGRAVTGRRIDRPPRTDGRGMGRPDDRWGRLTARRGGRGNDAPAEEERGA